MDKQAFSQHASLQASPSALEAPPASPAAPSHACPGPAPRRLHSRDLLGQGRELEIEHAGQLYRLRLTQLGKLILTK
ncbi:MAG TPA: hemin uptake protein HemP [Burkholderiaceae bacterium]|nr:hemin uptake protein HemP [Burkholderiaceae bacterium]